MMSESKSTEASPDEAKSLPPQEKGRLRQFFERRRAQVRRFWRQNQAPIHVTLLFFLFLFVYLLPDIVFSLYPGQAGVLWRRFGGGTETNWVYHEGFHVKFPWDKVYTYNIRLQEHLEIYDVLSKDGLAVDVEASVRFRPFEKGLGLLHKNLGPEYVKTLLVPDIGSLVRKRISQLDHHELYTRKRLEIESDITEQSGGFDLRYTSGGKIYKALHVEKVLIRSITLPASVAESIEQKLVREQDLLKFDYQLAIEKKERERKRIEAQGIRIFQDIVSEGISEQYLKWKGIDATLELARSDNSKIVVIGAGTDGMPIILGGLDYPAAPSASFSAAAAAPGTAGVSSGATPSPTAPPANASATTPQASRPPTTSPQTQEPPSSPSPSQEPLSQTSSSQQPPPPPSPFQRPQTPPQGSPTNPPPPQGAGSRPG